MAGLAAARLLLRPRGRCGSRVRCHAAKAGGGGGGGKPEGGGGGGKRSVKQSAPRPRQAVTRRETGIEETDFVLLAEEGYTVTQLAEKIGKPVTKIITFFFAREGLALTVNSSLDRDHCVRVCEDFGLEVLVEEAPESAAADRGFLDDVHTDAAQRPPVVTVMGHVDHGKTTLLDTIRQRSVAATEAGGITQRIGAYTVEVDGQRVTFIDTPGHEAFTSMRARGAQVTDMAVLVVAADDGVMPQTREAIAHARAAGVPIIVAINKIDVKNADPEKARQKLAEEGLICEEWGGDVAMVECSAKKNIGLDSLLEIITLTAQVQELTAKMTGPAAGVVLESAFDPLRGTLASVLVQRGMLKVGDCLVAGAKIGRVRLMQNEAGTEMDNVGPSTAVQVSGFTEPPDAGDQFEVYPNMKAARVAGEKRERELGKNRGSAGFAASKGGSDEMVRLAIILKTDAQGSIDAVKHMFNSVKGSKYVNIRWVLAAPGVVTSSDIELATACPQDQRVMVIGFNSSVAEPVAKLAKLKGIEIRTFDVIYELFETVVAALETALGVEEQLLARGRARVKAVFGGRDGNVAGCLVEEGMLKVGNVVKVFRNGEVVIQAPILSLRQGKESVQDVDEDNECGFCLKGWDAWEVGDEVSSFESVSVQPKILDKDDYSKKDRGKRK